MAETVEFSGDGADELSDTQKEILRTAVKNPDMSNAEIAAEVGCSESWVYDTRSEYEDEMRVEDDDSSGGFGLLLILLLILAFGAQQAGLI